jgi:spore cortex formation protein SpoVR/YcgB (stage V sporulation)
MINWAKDKEKDIEPKELARMKHEARKLAKAYGMDYKPAVWWIESDDNVYLILNDPSEDLGKE